MHLLLERLDNEKDLYAKRIAEGRTDLLGQLLLKRIDKEIKRIEREIEHEKSKNKPTCEPSRGLIYYVKEVGCRYWSFIYSNYCPVSRVPTSTTLQAKEGLACEIRH